MCETFVEKQDAGRDKPAWGGEKKHVQIWKMRDSTFFVILLFLIKEKIGRRLSKKELKMKRKDVLAFLERV